jgi:hypothetical protein
VIGTRKDGTVPTHAWATFDNPYLVCRQCGQPVRNWHDEQQCGTPAKPCPVSWYLAPCGHQAEARSECPTWTPGTGCQCLAQLGRQDHATARR